MRKRDMELQSAGWWRRAVHFKSHGRSPNSAGLYRPGQIVSAFVNVDLLGGTIIEGHVGEDVKPVGLDDAI